MAELTTGQIKEWATRIRESHDPTEDAVGEVVNLFEAVLLRIADWGSDMQPIDAWTMAAEALKALEEPAGK